MVAALTFTDQFDDAKDAVFGSYLRSMRKVFLAIKQPIIAAGWLEIL